MEVVRASRVFVVTSILLFVVSSTVTGAVLSKSGLANSDDDGCKEHEVFSACQADQNCEKSCENIDVWESVPCIQTKNCVSGCICDEGYVRDKSQGVCVWENSCPRIKH